MTHSLRLNRIQAGEIVRMLGFVQCDRSGLRLAEMGLTPGTSIEVLQAAKGQPMLLRVRGSQLAIDRQAAGKIKVELATDGRHACGQRRRGWRRSGGRNENRWGAGRRGWKHWRGPNDHLQGEGDEERGR
ncbi:MAG: FeoA family protein [Anaerolineales bacterium]